jgi:tRNA wybutosine-synthesizing protein 1
MCYKAQFYGVESHRCVQMTPTLKCNQRCLYCWRSFEHDVGEERECSPDEIISALPGLQKRALSGYKVSPYVTPTRFHEALAPRHVAISLSGEPTLYEPLPTLISSLTDHGYSTFLVSNGTRPDVLAKCRPMQLYLSLTAADPETYQKVCRPIEDSWEYVQESLAILGTRRSAIRITLVEGVNDTDPAGFARLAQNSGATYIEVKGYMYLGYSRRRLSRNNMPEHTRVQAFAREIASCCDYTILDECPESRVVLMGRS